MRGADEPLRVGVSSCLLGTSVRFDGGHKHERFLTDVLGRYVEWVPVCPEVEMGMGVPREPVRLVGDIAAPRMLGAHSGTDHTAAMRRYAAARVRALGALGLCGYVFKKDSPSCGAARVRVDSGAGRSTRSGRGLFAAAFIDANPLLPVEEEDRLRDSLVRETFIERIFGYYRWRVLLGAPSRGALVAFHAAHKFLLLAHDPRAYAALGRLVGDRKGIRSATLARRYGERLMAALAVPATVAKHGNVLQHLAGMCRDRLSAAERRQLTTTIDRYRRGRAPLRDPMQLLREHAERHGIADVRGQVYLASHPRELMLRARD